MASADFPNSIPAPLDTGSLEPKVRAGPQTFQVKTYDLHALARIAMPHIRFLFVGPGALAVQLTFPVPLLRRGARQGGVVQGP